MVIGFYSQEGKYGEFSNAHVASFVVNGRVYATAEQYISYQKAMLMGDIWTAERIMQTCSPLEAKFLGEIVCPCDDSLWRRARFSLSLPGIYEKFVCNGNLRDLLLSTWDEMLAYCSVEDRVWGIGLEVDDYNVQDKALWNGENLLGELLMTVRNLLVTDTPLEFVDRVMSFSPYPRFEGLE